MARISYRGRVFDVEQLPFDPDRPKVGVSDVRKEGDVYVFTAWAQSPGFRFREIEPLAKGKADE